MTSPMSLAPLLNAGPLIAAHAMTAMAAFGLGAAQLLCRKGTTSHRMLGWLWIVLMVFIAAGSFGIHTIRQFGPFSWIHGLSLFALVMLVVGVAHARAGRIEAHRWTMIGLFVGALVIAGAFTLAPGRVMHHVVFGS